jgi:3-oxoacyl-[acyl-carrier protein] reductase
VARDAAALAQVAGEIGGAAVLSLDIATADAPARIAAEAARLGGADVLINNAAIQGPIGLMTEVDWDALEHTFRVDFLAPMALSRALAPQMIAKGAGWIVNISGGGATGPRPMFVAYGAAKTALVRASETLAAELAPLGIRVNAIAPGAFRSGMTLETLAAGGAAGAKEESVAKNLVDKDDDQAARRAAALIAYLAAGAGRDVSGRLISAVWDPWETLHERAEDLLGSDIYTLRRITPGDRGKDWGG